MEIKVKGWNTKTKKMYLPEEMEKDQLTLTTTGEFINCAPLTEQSEVYHHIIPILFTGFRDKNGSSIYDGDFIRNSLCEIIHVYWHKDYHSWYGFCKKRPKDQAQRQPFHKFGDFPYSEIIGNQWENPKLEEKYG